MGSPIRFHKMQGVGNDFVVVDGREHPPMNWSRFSMRVCDRRFGIGADGLLVLDHSESADILMRMFNPDGTPDVCGNGMRCVARFEYNRLRGSAVYPEHLTLETLAGIRTARPVPESEGAAWKVEMGAR